MNQQLIHASHNYWGIPNFVGTSSPLTPLNSASLLCGETLEPPHDKTIGKHKDADQLRGNREADQRLVFAARIVQFLPYLYTKFPDSCFLL